MRELFMDKTKLVNKYKHLCRDIKDQKKHFEKAEKTKRAIHR